MKATIYNSLFNSDSSKSWSIPRYTCSTGNCTWDPIATLEIRASCANITDKLEYEFHHGPKDQVHKRNDIGLQPNYTFSSLKSGGTNITADIETTFLDGTLVIFGSMPPLVYNDTFMPPIQLIAPDGLLGKQLWNLEGDFFMVRDPKMQAIECTVYPAVRSFRPRVTEGVYHEETLEIWEERPTKDFWRGDRCELHPPWGPEKGVGPGKVFAIGMRSVQAMRYFFRGFFTGQGDVSATGYFYTSTTGFRTEAIGYASADLMQLMVLSNITGCTASSVEKLHCVMDNVATAMSKAMRDDESSSNLATTDGKAMTSLTYVSIHWQWIVLPVLVWLLGLVTLLGTMWKTRRAMIPTWKNQTIPIISLCRNSHNETTQGDQAVENERVRLYESEGKMMLSGQASLLRSTE
ncbi:unnamed protein product [Penicillium nalgiovense]|uniref:Uncharacterized protein n=1 Tax=Penicillium nalgiovense TaxID=60175 RepID=A0A9W4IQ07_PENNA|nr:unnamed protein product [Penicillium nalgiovense]CAG7948331.1 unnamed protein product [Penicillium nalgiovense]CAG7998363.1 unnamed protein product [Penicillium nalgiovense]CAG8043062.1 unnamed protein product [Penicillium nalgiovense]CAG8045038.1 unnamed protein product [Penicillium nalgiovense]